MTVHVKFADEIPSRYEDLVPKYLRRREVLR